MTSQIEIKNLNPTAFQSAVNNIYLFLLTWIIKKLEFIYSGDTLINTENAAALLEIANQFVIDGLSALCEKSLFTSISLDNVFELIQFAHFHHLKNLETFCINFISSHLSQDLSFSISSLPQELQNEIKQFSI